MKKDKNNDILNRAAALISVTLLIVVLILLIVYSKFKYNIGVVCPVHELFGYNCPGCGGTRMAVSILKGELYQAFRYNPFIFITAPVVIVIYLYQSYMFIVKNHILKWLDKFLIIYAIALIMFGIIRNIGPFRWLSPTLIN